MSSTLGLTRKKSRITGMGEQKAVWRSLLKHQLHPRKQSFVTRMHLMIVCQPTIPPTKSSKKRQYSCSPLGKTVVVQRRRVRPSRNGGFVTNAIDVVSCCPHRDGLPSQVQNLPVFLCASGARGGEWRRANRLKSDHGNYQPAPRFLGRVPRRLRQQGRCLTTTQPLGKNTKRSLLSLHHISSTFHLACLLSANQEPPPTANVPKI